MLVVCQWFYFISMKLEIGSNTGFDIRKEVYLTEDGPKFSVLYLSDFHFNGHSSAICFQLIKQIKELDPTIILLGGDYVDTRHGLVYLDRLFFSMRDRAHVYAISGNHDRFFGQKKIRKIAQNHHIQWLDNSSILLQIDGYPVEISNNLNASSHNIFRILCLHQPKSIDQSLFNLVFAGHLHGSQVVLWANDKGLFPGRFFYRWNILKATSGICDYYISKGLGDTLPFRYNCRKDVVFVEIN